MHKIWSPILILILLSACVNRFDYNSPLVGLEAETDKTVAVGTLDSRPYVNSGDKTPDFVGLQRGSYGIPFSVFTFTKKPMADDLTSAVVEGLRAKGIDVSSVITTPSPTNNEALNLLAGTDTDRDLLITLYELKSDGAYNHRLFYDVEIVVLDGDGKLLARTKAKEIVPVSDLEDLAAPLGAEFNSGLTGDAFRLVLATMLNEDEIKNALK